MHGATMVGYRNHAISISRSLWLPAPQPSGTCRKLHALCGLNAWSGRPQPWWPATVAAWQEFLMLPRAVGEEGSIELMRRKPRDAGASDGWMVNGLPFGMSSQLLLLVALTGVRLLMLRGTLAAGACCGRGSRASTALVDEPPLQVAEDVLAALEAKHPPADHLREALQTANSDEVAAHRRGSHVVAPHLAGANLHALMQACGPLLLVRSFSAWSANCVVKLCAEKPATTFGRCR